MRSLVLLLLLALGSLLGAWLGRTLFPVELVDSGPAQLTPAARADYVRNIAIAYRAERDAKGAAERLDFLAIASLPEFLLAVAEQAITAGHPRAEILALAELASAFGITSAMTEPYLQEGTP